MAGPEAELDRERDGREERRDRGEPAVDGLPVGEPDDRGAGAQHVASASSSCGSAPLEGRLTASCPGASAYMPDVAPSRVSSLSRYARDLLEEERRLERRCPAGPLPKAIAAAGWSGITSAVVAATSRLAEPGGHRVRRSGERDHRTHRLP